MEILSGRVYKHFKGGYVLVLSTAKHSDRDEIEVVYKGLNNGQVYVRPLESFVSVIKDEKGKEIAPRFTLAREEEVSSLLTREELGQIEIVNEFIQKKPEIKKIY